MDSPAETVRSSVHTLGEKEVELASGLVCAAYALAMLISALRVYPNLAVEWQRYLLIGLLLAAGVYLIAVGMVKILLIRRWERDGQLAPGQIVAAELERDPAAEGKCPCYQVTVRFTVRGKPYTLRQRMFREDYESWKAAPNLPVKYLPANPEVARILA
jgi:hypothetical protein